MDLDALFDRTASLAARPRTVCELPGGITNRNYRVTTPEGTFVARVSSGGSELLAIDRDCEYRNSVIAAAAGVGAPVVEYRPEDSVLVLGYIEGRTFGNADVAAVLRQAAAQQDRPGPAARPRGQVRVDAVGRHTERREPARLRLLVVGHGTVRGRRGGLHSRRLRPPARGRPAR